MKFIHKDFFYNYRLAFGKLRQSQVNGIAALLKFIEQDTGWDMLRKDVTIKQIAYMLATVKHECADTWQPIEEYGKGKGKEYGKVIEIRCNGHKKKVAFYGRGYVQTTWKDNYRRMSERYDFDPNPMSNSDNELVCNPDLATEPDNAYILLSEGMREGLYTGKKLSDYINSNKCDYFHARRIINRLDKAKLIEGYAQKLAMVLVQSYG